MPSEGIYDRSGLETQVRPPSESTEIFAERNERAKIIERNAIKIDTLLTLSERAHTRNPDSALCRALSGAVDFYVQNRQEQTQTEARALQFTLDRLIDKLANPDAQIEKLSTIDPGNHPPIMFHIERMRMDEIKTELQHLGGVEDLKALLRSEVPAEAK